MTQLRRRSVRLNLWLLKLSRNWLRVVLVLIGLYAAAAVWVILARPPHSPAP